MFKKIVKLWKHCRLIKNMPLRLEFVVTDYCNLNCKGCTHFSSLAAKEFEPLGHLKKVMNRLSKVCEDKLDSVYLIGGETLLYPQLKEAMKAMRDSFPFPIKAYIFTNGIALPKMDDEFWAIARELDFIISITRYPIKFDYESVIELSKSKGLKTEVFGDRSLAESFFRFGLDRSKKQNGWISHFRCYNRGCVSVIGDKLYPCPISGCIKHLNKACGTDFQHVKGDWLDVEKITSVKQILKFRAHPVPFCKYCINPPTEVKYGPSRRDVSEWVEK